MPPIAPSTLPRSFQVLQQRCAALGIPLWRCDADGTPAVYANEPVPLSPLTNSPVLQKHIEAAARALAAATEPATTEILPGCWLVPLIEKEGSRRIAMVLAMLFEEALCQTPQFSVICTSSGLDHTEGQRIIRPFLKRNKADIDQAAAVLRWNHDDLVQADRARRAMDEFSDKLAQSYEETNLLYRLAGLMNSPGDPAQLVQSVCSEAHQILPFQWLAARFQRTSGEIPELAGHLVVAGDPPCNLDAFDKATASLMEQADPDRWWPLLEPQNGGLAALTGSEVVAAPITHDGRTIGILAGGNKRGHDSDICSAEIQFVTAAANFLGIFHENMSRFAEQHALFTGMLQALTASIDAKDRYTCGHSERVGFLASQMAIAMNLDKRQIDQFRIAGLLHDVGKIGVPETVLCKNGRLTNEEFALIKRHPEVGHGILKDVPTMQEVIQGVLHHHEQWCGRGYPNGLAGENIPLIARVLSLADAFDAMSSNRSYRSALLRPAVMAEIQRCAGVQFDPALVPIFLNLDFAEFDSMLQRHQILSRNAA